MKGNSGYVKYYLEWIDDDNPLMADPEKLQFTKEIAKARTGFAKEYLVYGKMSRPPEILTPTPNIKLDYDHYNDFFSGFRKGFYEVNSLVTQAWITNEKLGILFVNILKKPMKISFKLDTLEYGLFLNDTYKFIYKTQDKSKTLHRKKGEKIFSVTLPSRKVVLIEVNPDN